VSTEGSFGKDAYRTRTVTQLRVDVCMKRNKDSGGEQDLDI
jgi:hypothetical protein